MPVTQDTTWKDLRKDCAQKMATGATLCQHVRANFFSPRSLTFTSEILYNTQYTLSIFLVQFSILRYNIPAGKSAQTVTLLMNKRSCFVMYTFSNCPLPFAEATSSILAWSGLFRALIMYWFTVVALTAIRQQRVTLSPSEAYVIGRLGQEFAATL